MDIFSDNLYYKSNWSWQFDITACMSHKLYYRAVKTTNDFNFKAINTNLYA